ncbi:MAG TPA: hypothetical protein PLU43_05795, partial [Lachnospiraceae bacterium]|nr:hypothetical protein [Lachnospiraceae bacterium]
MKEMFMILKATVQKEITMFIRYLPNMIGTILQLGVRFLFFFYLSGITAYNGSITGKNLFLFFGAALLLYVIYSTTIWAPLNTVTTDLYNGTLEYIYVTPVSKFCYYFGTGISQTIMSMVFFVPIFAALVLYSGVGFVQVGGIFLVAAAGTLNCIAIGVLLSLLGIIWKQVGAITGIIAVLFEFLAGAYAPVQTYSIPVKAAAFMLPFTWGYDLARYYLMGEKWTLLLPEPVEWCIYLGMAVLYFAAALLLMERIQNRMLRNGLYAI